MQHFTPFKYCRTLIEFTEFGPKPVFFVEWENKSVYNMYKSKFLFLPLRRIVSSAKYAPWIPKILVFSLNKTCKLSRYMPFNKLYSIERLFIKLVVNITKYTDGSLLSEPIIFFFSLKLLGACRPHFFQPVDKTFSFFL